MLETQLKKLIETLDRIADALEASNAPGTSPASTGKLEVVPDPEPEEPKAEPEEVEEEPEPEEKPAKKKGKPGRKKKEPEPEPEPESEEDDDDDDDDEFDDDDKVVEYKTVADHIRKKREQLIKSKGPKGAVAHKKVTKALLDEWGIGRVKEVEEEQMAVFFEELKAAEDEADL